MNQEGKGRQKDPRVKDVITGIVSLVLFLLFFGFSFAIEVKTVGGSVSSRTIPQFVSSCGIIVSLILILKNLFPYLKAKKSGEQQEPVYTDRKRWGQLAISVALMVGYILLMRTFGFMLTSAVYLFLQMLAILEDRSKKRVILIAVIAVLVPVILYIPFRYGFQLMIPVGTIFR